MKRWSIKLKLTCLYGGFMILLIVAALAILFSLSNQEVLSSVQSDLKKQVQGCDEQAFVIFFDHVRISGYFPKLINEKRKNR